MPCERRMPMMTDFIEFLKTGLPGPSDRIGG
jgi:hypothetical protein